MNELDIIRSIGQDENARDADARRRARTRLDIAITAAPRVTPPASRGVPRWRWVAVVAGIAIALLSISVVLPRGAGGPKDATADRLRALSRVAGLRASGDISAGQVLYVHFEGIDDGQGEDLETGLAWAYEVSVRGERWSAPDGSGRIIERTGSPRFVSKQDRDAWVASGRPPLTEPDGLRSEDFAAGELGYLDITDLPSDPKVLADAIIARELGQAPPGGAFDLDIVASLLRISEASPQARAAVFRAMEHLPGVRYVGQVNDHAGRPGVAFSATTNGRTITLVFDPITSALLEEQRSADGVTSWRTFIETGVVEEIGERP